MSDLNDPRVLFAAERTLLAWNRTAAGLFALGFLIDRSALLDRAAAASHRIPMLIGAGFICCGIAVLVLAIVQYRRALASLRPVEIPPGYWVNFATGISAATALLGLALLAYLLFN